MMTQVRCDQYLETGCRRTCVLVPLKMADSDFEQLTFLPPVTLYPKSSVDPYTLVHDILFEDEVSPEEIQPSNSMCYHSPLKKQDSTKNVSTSEDGATDVRSMEPPPLWPTENNLIKDSKTIIPVLSDHTRRRRKLPEIPKMKKTVRQASLADELGTALICAGVGSPDFIIGGITRPLPLLKTLRGGGDDSSPDSERLHSADADSGNSTAHSPDLLKSGSPLPYPGSFSPVSGSSSADHVARLELLDPTHRGLHRFVPRHRDEVEIDIGDPIYVHKEADDLWCEGINLRTGLEGIFPSAHIVDVEYSDFDSSQPKVRRERYILGYLGSVETLAHKGNSVLCQAVKKIRSKDYTPHSCILEISDTGIRMVDRKRPVRKEVGCHDYFYSLKNVSFCAFHPREQRYLGFITKHPSCDRFACHVFVGCESTRPVAEAVGRAFQRFYQKFVETAYPVEDIYIE